MATKNKTKDVKKGKSNTGSSEENNDDQCKWRALKKYQWKPGQSGNPDGRPKGKSLKRWAAEFLKALPDDKKLEFLKALPEEIVWRMAEGNPINNFYDDEDTEDILRSLSDEELDECIDIAVEGLAEGRAKELLEERLQRKGKKARKPKGKVLRTKRKG